MSHKQNKIGLRSQSEIFFPKKDKIIILSNSKDFKKIALALFFGACFVACLASAWVTGLDAAYILGALSSFCCLTVLNLE